MINYSEKYPLGAALPWELTVGKISISFLYTFLASVMKAVGFYAILQNEHIYFYLPSSVSVSGENCSFQEHKACLRN